MECFAVAALLRLLLAYHMFVKSGLNMCCLLEGGAVSSLLVRHAALVVTMDDAGTRWPDGAIYAVDGVIREVGPTSQLPDHADVVIDARDLIIVPGLVNTHHHFFQTLTRNLPVAQNAGLFGWLRAHYPIWARLTPEAIKVATKTAIAELMLSGCTTSVDHTYIWPNGARLDDQIEVAQALGFRFHASRGSMSVGESKGGLPPDSVVEDEETILLDSRRVIEQYHDPARYALVRIVLAPCSPFSVSLRLMRESAELARSYGVHLHTHLAETADEIAYCREMFGHRPVTLAEKLGWLGPDVWHAHAVHLTTAEAQRFGETKTGWHTARPQICVWARALPRFLSSSSSVRGWDSELTVRPRTTLPTCSLKPAKPCSCIVSMKHPGHSPPMMSSG